MAEKALTRGDPGKPYVQGVSTRSVDELVKAMGMTGISKSQVQPVYAARSTARSRPSSTRPLEGEWPYIWLGRDPM